jgi:alginate O-acetyltransferase complex protein AlgI
MLFTTTTFIFYFLPTCLFVYYLFLRKNRIAQNTFLFAMSILFYAWGEPWFVLMMLLSIVSNWFFAMKIDQQSDNKKRRNIMILMLVCNFGIMFIFKYLNFTIFSMNSLLDFTIPQTHIVLPIGISFFTFQAVSYVLDVYRRHTPVQKKLMYVGFYVSFFPQLIAGPIVRYETIAYEIENRIENIPDFNYGVRRFMIGLGKKIIIANNVALVADAAFKANTQDILGFKMAWLGIIAYTLQIYFDFSGYSDMAIGMGKMFGFHFLENFNFPYLARSVSDFWRRWHISLSTWFRDYVYFPLGGSRVKSSVRLVFNLFVVWFLTGLWHGANWTFIVWGVMYFILIALEKVTGYADKLGFFGHFYTMAFVMIGWIIFRAETLTLAMHYFEMLFRFNSAADQAFLIYFSEFKAFILLGIAVSLNIPQKAFQLLKLKDGKLRETLIQLSYAILFLICITYIVKGSYNPFIYFNF